MSENDRDPSRGRGHSRVKGQWADGSPVIPAARAFDCMFHDEGIPDAPCACGGEEPPHGTHDVVPGEVVKRVNRYMVQVEGVRIRATTDQEARIAALSDEERARFITIMGGPR